MKTIYYKQIPMTQEIRQVAEILHSEGREVFCLPAKLVNNLYWIEKENDGKVLIYSICPSASEYQLRVHYADKCERVAVAPARELLRLRYRDGDRYYVHRGHFFWGDWIKLEF
ncbi:MAG: hypothetical protein QXS54_12205 [Candidatus Methanomethylicaceae archaeon]